jgi:hypothetical protein
MKCTTTRLALAAGLLLLFPFMASATLLDGRQLQFEHHFDDFGEVLASQIAVVGPGIEFTYFDLYTVDVSDTSILIDFTGNCGCFWSTGNFNGPSFFDVFVEIDPFISVTLTTNMPGLSPGNLILNAERVSINWQGLPFEFDGSMLNDDLFVRLDLTGGAPVPEPGGLALLALGLMALRRPRKARPT